MNEKEKKDLYIATCKCCLLAEAMKTCSTCRFNIGLAEKNERIQPIPVSLPVPVTLFAVFDCNNTSIEFDPYSQGEFTI